MSENITQDQTNVSFKGYVGVSFSSTPRAYFFGCNDLNLKVGQKVVVETAKGVELGEVAIKPQPMSEYHRVMGLKPILRLASDIDIRVYNLNKKTAEYSFEICKMEIERLNLPMRLISCEYTLDKSKILFTYLADERVDFRELLKVLALKFHTRIELRQLGTRDKAKMIGGLGVCGRPLCCCGFLNEFDGISISRAKNQMLAINIPKLSGHCGKLMCCLKFEDETYTKEKKDFPEIGSKLFIDKTEYTVNSINVIARTVKIENGDETKVLSLDDFKKQAYPVKSKINTHAKK